MSKRTMGYQACKAEMLITILVALGMSAATLSISSVGNQDVNELGSVDVAAFQSGKTAFLFGPVTPDSPRLTGIALQSTVDMDADGLGEYIVCSGFSSKEADRTGCVVWVVSGKTGRALTVRHLMAPPSAAGWSLIVSHGPKTSEGLRVTLGSRYGLGTEGGTVITLMGPKLQTSKLWTCQAILDVSGEAPPHAAWFGSAVASGIDVNGDGKGDVIVGWPKPDHVVGSTQAGVQSEGCLVALSGDDGAILYRRSRVDDPGWGGALCVVADADGDEVKDIVVGNDREGTTLLLSGRSGTTLRTLFQSKGEVLLGSTLAATEDLDGNGTPDILIGSHSDHVALVSMENGETLAMGTVMDPDGMNFTEPVVMTPDVDGDGFGDYVLGEQSLRTGDPGGGGSYGARLFSGRSLDALSRLPISSDTPIGIAVIAESSAEDPLMVAVGRLGKEDAEVIVDVLKLIEHEWVNIRSDRLCW